MENEEIISGVQAAINAGLSMAAVELTNKTPTVVIPAGASFEAHVVWVACEFSGPTFNECTSPKAKTRISAT